jgi:2-haloacid dehalogenase
MAPWAVVFDLNGTLVDQEPLVRRLTELGAPAGSFQAWFERLLHSALTVSVAGEFAPFDELARSTLATTLAQLEVGADPDEVIALMGELPLAPGALEALDVLDGAGVRAAVLTNSGAGYTEALLARNGVLGRFAAVVSAVDVGSYKPTPGPYRAALQALGLPPAEAAFVAAHGWDVVGARSAGLDAVWVDRSEREWPFPGPQPARAPGLAEAARKLVTARS